jgi:hypothetical protein
VDVCLNVPDGYSLVGIMDDNEEMITTSECIQTFVSGESVVFLFEMQDLESPEPVMSFGLTTKHEGKVKKLDKEISGVRKWTEDKLEKPNHEKIKKLKPKWEKRAKKLLEKMNKKKKAAK